MNNLIESNSLRHNISTQTERKGIRTLAIDNRLTSNEATTNNIERELSQGIDQIDSVIKNRKRRFIDIETIKKLEDKINHLEDIINQQYNSIDELKLKFSNISSEINAKSLYNQKQEMKLAQLINNALIKLNIQLAQLHGSIEQRIVEINQILKGNLKVIQEGVNSTNDEIRIICEGKIDNLKLNFEKFCNNILVQMNEFAQEHQKKLIDYGQSYKNNLKGNKNYSEQFNVVQAERIMVEHEQAASRKQEAEEFLLKHEEDERKRKEVEDQEVRRNKELDERILREVIEKKEIIEEEKKRLFQEERINSVLDLSDFEVMNLDQKKAWFIEHFSCWKNNYNWANVYEIKISNDELFLFLCNAYLGILY